MSYVSKLLAGLPPSPTMAADARAKAKIAAGADIINLAAGEPDMDSPDVALAAAHRAIDQGWTRYGPVAGLPALRHAIAAQAAARLEQPVTADQVIVTTGGKHALMGAFRTLLDPGDEVLLPTPCWVSMPAMIVLAGGVPVRVPTRAALDFVPTPEQLEAAITPRTKVISLCSPSNPTGGAWGRAAIESAVTLARKHDLVLISDEVYRTLTFDSFVHASPAELAPERTVIIDSVSKAYAMTGWRIGWAIGPTSIIGAMASLQSQTTSGMPAINQAAALAALGLPEDFHVLMRKTYQRRMQAVVGRLQAIDGVQCARPRGAFYIFPDVSALFGLTTPEGTLLSGSADVQDSLLEAGIAVVAGAPFGDDRHIRISYAAGLDTLTEALDRFARWRSALS